MDNEKRIAQFREHMKVEGIAASFIFNPDLQFYLTGFRALLYSRPIVLVIDQDKSSIIIPGLEEVHAREVAKIDELLVYYEHPNAPNKKLSYIDYLNDLITLLENKKVGLDLDTAPSTVYLLFKERGFNILDIGNCILQMRFIKSDNELIALKDSSLLVDLAVKHSLSAAKVGVTEMEIDNAGTNILFEQASKLFPNATLDHFSMSPSGALRSTMPHVFSNTRKIESGDVIIHSRQVGLNGYRSELERTVIVGKADSFKRKALKAATDAQVAALNVIKAGVKASAVDQAARDVFIKEGFLDHVIHRTGHAIGVAAHEPPFIRYDNDMLLEVGMVFTIEPGIYIPDIGGFRHSDTIVITQNGYEMLTNYSNNIEDLILN